MQYQGVVKKFFENFFLVILKLSRVPENLLKSPSSKYGFGVVFIGFLHYIYQMNGNKLKNRIYHG